MSLSEPLHFPKNGTKNPYTRLYHVVLRRRACHFCAITLLTSAGILWISVLDGTPALWNGFRISFWLMAGATWASATIPMMVLRRTQKKTPPSSCLTRFQLLVSIVTSAQYIAAVVFLSFSALLLCACYIAAASALNEQPDLRLFKSIPGRGASQVNERPIYLAASALFCAFCYSFHMVYEQKFPSKRAESSESLIISQRMSRTFPNIFGRTHRLAFFASVSFLPIYLILRRYIIRAIVFSRYTQLTKFIKPHLVMMIKFNSIFTFTSNLRLVILNILTILTWEIAQAFWDVYCTQPLAISHFSDEPNHCLLEGLRSADMRIQISWSDPPRRVTIFRDIRTQPKIFNAIVDECLKVITTTQAMVSGRGQLALTEQSSTSPTAAVPATQASSAPGRSALKKDLPQLFTSQPQSNSLKQVLLSKFLASPAETSPLEPPAQTHDASSAKELVGHGYQIPSIFQKRRERSMVDSSSSSIASSTVTKKPLAPKAPDSNTTGPKQKIIPKAWEMTRKLGILKSTPCLQALEEWLFFPSVGMDVRRSLSNHRTCALAVEAVTNMICVSLTEDQYGVAQAQIPRVMECLIECLETVKTFSMKICEEYGSGKSSGDENRTRETPVRRSDEDLREALDEFVSPLLTRLNDGTLGILNQFGPYLKEWQFNTEADAWIQARMKKI